jgi:DNA-binding MarR family transcriptional regulator
MPRTAVSLVATLQRANRLSVREYRGELARLGLTARQAAVLLAVHAEPGAGVTEAAEQVGADMPTASALVAKMEERQLIARRDDPDDRRRSRLFLTDAGVALVRPVTAARDAADARIASAAGSEAPALRLILSRLIAALTSERRDAART